MGHLHGILQQDVGRNALFHVNMLMNRANMLNMWVKMHNNGDYYTNMGGKCVFIKDLSISTREFVI